MKTADLDLYSDLVTKKLKQKSEKTKNEMMRDMIRSCIHNTLEFRFVLMDSWFSSEENFEFIVGKGRHFIAALKDYQQIALRWTPSSTLRCSLARCHG
jgi:hypothetical protein